MIAQAIAKELDGDVLSVQEVTDNYLQNVDLLVVGSPINGWRPSEKMIDFLDSLDEDVLAGKKAASFDTRVKFFLHGDAAGKISKALHNAGASIVTSPHGFVVKGTEGPLDVGEKEKAVSWAREIKRLV